MSPTAPLPAAPLLLRPRLGNLVKLLLYSCILIGLAFISLFFGEPNLFIQVIAVLGILLGIAGVVLNISKLIMRRPTLIIQADGVYPNYLPKSGRQLIAWEDIARIVEAQQDIPYFRRTKKGSNKLSYLAIYLKNPAQYHFEKNLTKAMTGEMMTALNQPLSGAPLADIYVPEILLPGTVGEVLTFLEENKFPAPIDHSVQQL